jgi:hypothetical protein
MAGLALALVCDDAVSASFVVKSSASGNDSNLNDNVCSTAAPANANTCTLHAAIQQGNQLAGTHNITFDPSITKITLTASLPQVISKVVLDGTNAAAVASGGRVEIDGATTNGCFDLREVATAQSPNGARDSTVKNFLIRRCQGSGISLSGHGYTITGNRIGTNPAGDSGSSASDANSGAGISISGTAPVPAAPPNLAGIVTNLPETFAAVQAFSASLQAALAVIIKPTFITGNLVSGNTGVGINLFGQGTVNVIVAGNIVGLSQNALSAVPNGRGPGNKDGIRLEGTAYGNFIGPGNIVSGNGGSGIALQSGSVLLPNFVAGNLVGLGSAPTDVGNAENGITVDSFPKNSGPGANNPTGFAAFIGPANTVSDNKSDAGGAAIDVVNADTSGGLLITGQSRGVEVFANVIGLATFPAGSTPLGQLQYGNNGNGIVLTVPNVRISRNIILANGRHGILLRGSQTTGARIQGNFIGVSVPTGLAPAIGLGNGGDGIHLFSASSNLIGGPAPSDKNIIAGNTRNGIALRNGSSTSGWSNLIQRNQIYGNARGGTGIGIDLERQANVPDEFNPSALPTNYANFDQVAPVLCGSNPQPPACGVLGGPSFAAGGTTLNWTLPARPQTPARSLRLEFFANAADGSSQMYLGEQTVTVDTMGIPTGAACSGGLCLATVGGSTDTEGMNIVATATDLLPSDVPPTGDQPPGALTPANNTSEFSNTVIANKALEITTAPPLPGATQGSPYSVTFQADGGTGNYSNWVIAGGTLPNGLTLAAATGVLAGTPTGSGTSNFSVRVTDSANTQAVAAYQIQVTALPPLTITTPSPLPQGTVGTAYSQVLAASGGSGAASGWTIALGSLPPGLLISSPTGTISGTPTTPGDYAFTVQVQDAVPNTATRSYQLSIVPAPVPLAISNASPLPNANQNADYSVDFDAVGGSGIYTAFAVDGGMLPAGLTLASATGMLSGKPTEAGSFNFSLRVTDNTGAMASKAFALSVIAVPPPQTGPSTTVTPDAIDFGRVRVGQSVTVSLVVRNESAAAFDPEIDLGSGPILLFGSFTVSEGTCTTNIAPGQQCTMSVTFRPRRGNDTTYSDQAVITNATSGRPFTYARVDLSGIGEGRLADVAPTRIDFGSQLLNSITSVPITIFNPSSVTLALSGGNLLSTAGFAGPIIGCAGNTIPSGGSCTVTYRFVPTVIGAAESAARITLVHDVSLPLLPLYNESFDIYLSGTGVSLASTTSTRPVALDFGTVQVGRSDALTVTTQNISAFSLGITGGDIPAGDGPVWSRGPLCANPTTAGGTCLIDYTFAPRAAIPYSINTALTVTLAGNTRQVPLALSGTGSGTIARIAPARIDFGRVPVNATRSSTVTVTNLSSVTLTPNISFATPFVRSTTCGATLASGASCTVTYSLIADGSEIGPLLADAGIRVSNTLLGYEHSENVQLSAEVVDGIFGNGFE